VRKKKTFTHCAYEFVHSVYMLNPNLYGAFYRMHLDTINQDFTHTRTKYSAQSVLHCAVSVRRTGCHVAMLPCSHVAMYLFMPTADRLEMFRLPRL
jgi:hypothetical protein